jgi:iron complex transport system substrate-binding protein
VGPGVPALWRRLIAIMRIISLVPAGTEIVFALGLERHVVAVSHECDYPPQAHDLPRLTRSAIGGATLTSAAIDAAVSARKAAGSPLYHIDAEELTALAPDLILTQGLCDVCALPSRAVRTALAQMSPRPPIVSLDGRSIDGVLESMIEIGRATGREACAEELVSTLRQRLARVASAVADRAPVRVVCLEWLDPPYACGHWIPEMVQVAGGVDLLGRPGIPSVPISWPAVRDAHAPNIIAMPCGFTLERAVREVEAVAEQPVWKEAVGDATIYVAAGGGYFTRPGPRLVTGIELLAASFHPDRVDWPLPSDGLIPIGLPAGEATAK